MIKDILSPHRALLSDHTELRAQKNTSRGVSMLGGNLVGNTRAEKSGINARVYKNGVYGFASSAEYSEESIKSVLKAASDNAVFLSSRVSHEAKIIRPIPAGIKTMNGDINDCEQKVYIEFAKEDEDVFNLIKGLIKRQFFYISIDPYANSFNRDPNGHGHTQDEGERTPYTWERKFEIDSLCYPLRLAYQYWKETGDASIFDNEWIQAIANILTTFKEQQRKEGVGPYKFQRKTERALDTLNNNGLGAPVNPVGLIVSAFRPSDDATTLQFLVPSNFFAVSSLKKAAEILNVVNKNTSLAKQCTDLAQEVETALKEYATYNHPKYGTIYAFEVDGFGNHLLMDDANVPSLLAMPYLGDVDINDPIYQNTRRFVWSKDNPYFFKGKAGEGIGGPHIGYDMVWPMSIMMKAFHQSKRSRNQTMYQNINRDRCRNRFYT